MSATIFSAKAGSTPVTTPTPERPPQAGRVAQLKAALRSGGDFASQASLLAPGGGERLPGPVQAKMEHAFGSDFSDVRVHQDGQAEGMGAKAFARGNDVHFASGAYSPDSQGGQEVLGHELAHVVQQRQGRVAPTMQAKGGLGINTDVGLEHEADVMGAKAARGEVVQRGGGGAGSAPGGGVVQGLFAISPEDSQTAFGHDFENVPMRVSDDGTLAAPAGEDVKWFYATKDHIKSSNKILEGAKSQFRLQGDGGAYKVRSSKNKEVLLQKVIGTAPSRNEVGPNLSGGPNCNQMAGAVMGNGKVDTKKKSAMRSIKNTTMAFNEASTPGLDLMRMTSDIANGGSTKGAEKRATAFNEERASRDQVQEEEEAAVFEVKFADVEGARGRVNDCLMRWNGENRNQGRFNSGATSARVEVHKANKRATFEQELRHIEDDMRTKNDVRRPDCIESITDTGETTRMWFGKLDTSRETQEDNDTIDNYDQLDPVAKDKAHKKLGLNQYAAPEVGEAFGIHAVTKTGEQSPFPYHWAGVVAKAGSDTVTLENYAGRTVDQVYFTMYGSQTQVTVGPNAVRKADDQGSQQDKDSTTFHGQWERTFPNIHTITHATKMVGKAK